MRFRILAGGHIQNGPDGREHMYVQGDVIENPSDLRARWPEKFDRVDDSTPLTTHGWMSTPNATSGEAGTLHRDIPPKPVQEATPQQAQPPTALGALSQPPVTPPIRSGAPPTTLDTMTNKELVALAAEEEIDLKGATKRDDILKAIKSSAGYKG